MGKTMDNDDVSRFIKDVVCTNCGKKFEWEVFDEVAHDEVADVRTLGQCPSYPDCKKPDEMIEFIAISWERMM